MKADRERRELKFELTAQEKRAQVPHVVCVAMHLLMQPQRTRNTPIAAPPTNLNHLCASPYHLCSCLPPCPPLPAGDC